MDSFSAAVLFCSALGSAAWVVTVAFLSVCSPNAPNVEVRLEDRVGNPMLAFRGGAEMPMAPDPSAGYGRDGGYESGRQTDYNLLTLANPSNGVYSLVVQATHDLGDGSYPDAGYTLRVRIVPPTVVGFDAGSVAVTDQPAGNWRFFQINVPTNVRSVGICDWRT